jgi:NDP-sugar pyrophosphorylase family protein
MMPVAGRPIIERVLDMLAAGGATRFIVVAHPGSPDLPTYLSASCWADRIHLAYQGQRLGMAHALDCASRQIREREASEYLLASCDSLYPRGHVARLVARHRCDALDATLTLMWMPPKAAVASAIVVLKDGFVTKIIEKPRLEEMPSYGEHQEALSAPSLYALSPRVLDYLPRIAPSSHGEREFPDALRLLIEEGGLVGGQLVEDRMTLTHRDDLLAINRRVLRSDPACAIIEADLPRGVTIAPPVRIEAGASVASGCHIGPEVYLETGCTIGPGAVVRRSVVLRGASVEADRIVDQLVIA